MDRLLNVQGPLADIICGNPLDPDDNDIVTIRGRVAVGERVPNGFRVLTGNMHESLVVGTFYRFEIDEMVDGNELRQ